MLSEREVRELVARRQVLVVLDLDIVHLNDDYRATATAMACLLLLWQWRDIPRANRGRGWRRVLSPVPVLPLMRCDLSPNGNFPRDRGFDNRLRGVGRGWRSGA